MAWMKFEGVKDSLMIDTERIAAMHQCFADGSGTKIYVDGAIGPFEVKQNINEVAEVLEMSRNADDSTPDSKAYDRQKLAERIFDYIPAWDRDYGTVDDIVKDIKNDPEAVIEYLMDQLEGV